MALGGGTFLTQNKILPGSYINFVSASSSNANISDRGYAAVALDMSWGIENEIFAVTAEEFITDSMRIFGFEYTNDKLKGIRDIFLNAKTVYFYRTNGGSKASSDIGDAKYSGTRGNDISVTVESDEDSYIVSTYIENNMVDSQTVLSADKLADNDYVVFDKEAILSSLGEVNMAGGTETKADAKTHQKF